MKIKILKYIINRGDHVKVQSHNYRKGKWKPNPNWDWHKKVASGIDTIMYGIRKDSVKEYEKEVSEIKKI